MAGVRVGRRGRSAPRLFAAAVTVYGLGLLGWLLWPAFASGRWAVGSAVGPRGVSS
jgi:hypothetical protein